VRAGNSHGSCRLGKTNKKESSVGCRSASGRESGWQRIPKIVQQTHKLRLLA